MTMPNMSHDNSMAIARELLVGAAPNSGPTSERAIAGVYGHVCTYTTYHIIIIYSIHSNACIICIYVHVTLNVYIYINMYIDIECCYRKKVHHCEGSLNLH